MNAIELVKILEQHLNIPNNHHIIAVFEDDNSQEVKGFVVAEYGKEKLYPILTSKELINTYG